MCGYIYVCGVGAGVSVGTFLGVQVCVRECVCMSICVYYIKCIYNSLKELTKLTNFEN